MRIAHLSDLHLSPDHHPDRSDAFRAILQHCRSLKADHIVITGDITNQARPKELSHARGILKEFGLLDPERCTVVIGNHDIFGGPHFAEDVLSFPGLCKATPYDEKVKEFFHAFRETFDGCKYVAGSAIFPFVKFVQEAAFVGINSVAAWSSLKNPLGSNGEVNNREFERLQEAMEEGMLDGRTVFTLVHHHFSKREAKQTDGALERLWHSIESRTMKLRKKKRLLSLFQEHGVARVLHGHVHRHESYERKEVKFLNAGGTMFPDAEGNRRFHLLDLAEGVIRRNDIVVPDASRSRRRMRAAS